MKNDGDDEKDVVCLECKAHLGRCSRGGYRFYSKGKILYCFCQLNCTQEQDGQIVPEHLNVEREIRVH